MRKIQSVLMGCAALAVASSASSVFATTGTFSGPLTSGLVLSVDLNGGPLPPGATEPNEGYNSTLGSNQPDPFGVTWSPWGGSTGFGGDGTQLPSSQSSPNVFASSINKTFGAVGATISEPGTASDYAQGGGGATLNSRDRGNPTGVANDNDLFRDLVFAGGSGSNVQSENLIQLSLTGLAPLTQYSIALYSFDSTGTHSTNWSATAPTISNGHLGYWAATPVGNNTFTAPADEQTISWAGASPLPAPAVLVVTTDATGAASVYGFGGNGVTGNANSDTTYINGFQISTAVPEPASIGLLGLAAAGLLGRRSRKTV